MVIVVIIVLLVAIVIRIASDGTVPARIFTVTVSVHARARQRSADGGRLLVVAAAQVSARDGRRCTAVLYVHGN